jgi:hypothetical protein
MHSIKRCHIKSIRVAITLRELSKEFENGLNAHLGQYLEEMALSFKGITIGELEDYFDNQVQDNFPENLEKYDNIISKEIIKSLESGLKILFKKDLINLNISKLKISTYMIEYNLKEKLIAKILKKNTMHQYIDNFLINTKFWIESFKVPKFLIFDESETRSQECYYLIQEKINGEKLSCLLQTKYSGFADQIFFQIGIIVAKWRLLSIQVFIFLK